VQHQLSVLPPARNFAGVKVFSPSPGMHVGPIDTNTRLASCWGIDSVHATRASFNDAYVRPLVASCPAHYVCPVQSLRISGRRALKRSTKWSPIGRRERSGVLESWRQPCLISSAISITNAGEAGCPVFVGRESHLTRVCSLACKRICSDS
jgi:hypothetical protein